MSDENFKLVPKRIGSTIYNVKIYFSKDSNETLEDKILRNTKNDMKIAEA